MNNYTDNLDKIIEFLYENQSNPKMMGDIEKEVFGGDRSINVDGLVKFLESEGYIDNKGNSLLFLSFRGIILKECGGYKQKIINQNAENVRLENIESRAMVNRKTVTFLTWVIAAGTFVAAVYYGIEVWKFYQSCVCK